MATIGPGEGEGVREIQSADSTEASSQEGPAREGKQLRRELDLMLRYALSTGRPLDEKMRTLIVESEKGGYARLLEAHTALAAVVAPATPASLEATEPSRGFFGVFTKPPLIGFLTIVAVVAAIGFIVTLTAVIPPTKDSGKDPAKEPPKASATWHAPAVPAVVLAAAASGDAESSDAKERRKQLHWLFAAALGAAFYNLYAAHEYVRNRTFDPRYNSVYLIRFILGLVSGLILGNLAGAFEGNTLLARLGPGVLALLGGFSAEAVYQILQRLVEIALAVVRGDNAAAAKAKVTQAAQQELLALADEVDDATRKKVHAVVKKIT
ncbi:MAG TPA: hypothetical protein VEA38_02290 [Terriglobales bacterium]|nr:hypothetical protein [Terriglobales bacterium]